MRPIVHRTSTISFRARRIPIRRRLPTCPTWHAACSLSWWNWAGRARGEPGARQAQWGDYESDQRARGRTRPGGRSSIPRGATGLVLFAHGSGSSRHSPRNRHVAEVLNSGSIGTIQRIFLPRTKKRLTSIQPCYNFDIGLLVRRLTEITDWIRRQNNLEATRTRLFRRQHRAAAALATSCRHLLEWCEPWYRAAAGRTWPVLRWAESSRPAC